MGHAWRAAAQSVPEILIVIIAFTHQEAVDHRRVPPVGRFHVGVFKHETGHACPGAAFRIKNRRLCDEQILKVKICLKYL